MRLSLYEEKITWPGGSKLKPTGLMIPTHLNVLTIGMVSHKMSLITIFGHKHKIKKKY